MPLPLARNSVIMIMIYVTCYDSCYIFLYMEDIMVYVLHISIWKTLWYMYYMVAGVFMRYAGGRLGRWGCSRLLNRVAPPGGDGGLRTEIRSCVVRFPLRLAAITSTAGPEASLVWGHWCNGELVWIPGRFLAMLAYIEDACGPS